MDMITKEDREAAQSISAHCLEFAYDGPDFKTTKCAEIVAAHRESAAKAAEQAVLAKLRDLPLEKVDEIADLLGRSREQIHHFADVFADALEQKP